MFEKNSFLRTGTLAYFVILRTGIGTGTYFFYKNLTGTRTEKILKVPVPGS